MTGSAPTPQAMTLEAPWAYYQRKGLSEMRPYIAWEPLDGISVSEPDKAWLLDCQSRNADPGGYIARNPKNHADQWYVAQAYFEENLEPVRERDDTAELVEALEAYFEASDNYMVEQDGYYQEALSNLRAALAKWKERP